MTDAEIPPAAFAPQVVLAAELMRRLVPGEGSHDGAHDLAHVLRVWRNACRIGAAEGLDAAGPRGPALAAAVLLHDCVAVEKSSPLRARASRLAAARAKEILAALGWSAPATAEVAHAIAAHSFSAGIPPESLLARVLQDADRLDALGHIGIARCFYTGGRLGSALYHPTDPAAAHRTLDDAHYALDHFRAKLLRLGEGFQTTTGAGLAAERSAVVAGFLAGLEAELA